MACDGNCQSCPIQCGLTTLNKLESKAKEKTEMSEGALNCKPGDAEKIAVLLNENENLKQQIAAIGASTPLSTGVKTTSCLAIGAAVLALVVACYALSQTGKYADMIAAANINASEAVSISRKADTKAEAAGDRSEKNFVYLRDMKRDLKH